MTFISTWVFDYHQLWGLAFRSGGFSSKYLNLANNLKLNKLDYSFNKDKKEFNKTYNKMIENLQVELVQMQDWGIEKGKKIAIKIFHPSHSQAHPKSPQRSVNPSQLMGTC